jgi:HEAT repeat protein
VVEAPPAPPPPPPTYVPAEANRRAVDVLRAHLAVESLRVRRVAAAALGRQADPQAITTLLELLPTEQSEIAKLDIAYGLARATDARGLEILVAGLKSARRDVKAEAARLLASLRDARAASTPSALASLPQFRISASEKLAVLGNKPAIARLEKIRLDEQAPEEDRKRATIALGYAGQGSVVEPLRALLPDPRFNVGAAGALAVLGDASGRALLIGRLSLSSLRVEAAVALRRLEPALDASSILHPLMVSLASEKDTERVEAAEAVLILTSPAAMAERD